MPDTSTLPIPSAIPSGGTQDVSYNGRTHSQNHNDLWSYLAAYAAKIGIGPITSVPAGGLALLGRSDGSSIWTPANLSKNRLMNGDFRVAQRAPVAFTNQDNAYGLDRWRMLTEVTTTGFTIAQGSADYAPGGSRNYALMSVGSTTACKTGIFQPIEARDTWDLKGGTASLQFKAKVNDPRIGDVRAAICQWTGTEDALSADPISAWNAEGANPTLLNWNFLNTPANLNLTTSYQTFKIENVAIPSGTINLAVFIWNNDRSQNNGDFVEITDVQLEKGPLCTDYERRPYALELMLCQRYCEAMIGVGTTNEIGMGQAVSASQVNAPWTFKVRKRVFVNNYQGAGNFTAALSTGGLVTAGVGTVITAGLEGIMISFNTSGLTAGNASNVGMDSTGNPYLIASAEL